MYSDKLVTRSTQQAMGAYWRSGIGPILALLCAIMIGLVGISPALADSIADFAIFGDQAVSIGNQLGTTSMPVGDIGSNSSMSLNRFNDTTNLSGGGTLQVLANGNVVGNIVFNGDVTFGNNLSVVGNIDAGGKVTVGNQGAADPSTPSSVDGNVTAGGDFEVVRALEVTGNVDAGGNGLFGTGTQHIEGNLTLGGTITEGTPTVDGTTTENGSPATPTPYIPVAVPGASPFGAGGPDIIKGANQTTSLAPDTYGLLKLGNQNVLELTAPGEYFFNAWDIGAKLDLKLDLDLGAYKIFIVGDAKIGNDLEFFDLSSGVQLDPSADSALAANLILELKNGTFDLGLTSDWFGTVFAPDGDIKIGNEASLSGALYAGDENGDGQGGEVKILRFFQMEFVPSDDFGTPTLRVEKILIPDSDPGQFEMNANGQLGTGGDGAFAEAAVPAGEAANFSEKAVSGTNINSYDTTWSCSNGHFGVGASGSSFPMPDASVTCTFTNTRKTAGSRTLTVVNVLNPPNDPGLFVMDANGELGQEGGNGATSTAQASVGTPVTFRELAGTNTNLDDYVTRWSCTNGLSGNGPDGGSFDMPDTNVICTFTNTNNALIPIPTLSEWGIILLSGLLGLFMVMPRPRRI